MLQKPNILYIHCHDAGRFISPCGHACHTPALQKLAETGTLFRNAHCAAPTCSPSRTALLTGKYPHQVGMLGLAHKGWKLDDHERHLACFLNRHQYDTVLCGIQHEVDHHLDNPGQAIGYRAEITPAPSSPRASLPEQDVRIAEAAAQWIGARSSVSPPFFLTCGFFMPHRPFMASNPQNPHQDPNYLSVPSHLPDCEATRRDMADYNASVAHMDACVQKVLDALERSPHRDHTLVIATTDHGIAFPRMKCNLTDSGTGVFLILNGPGFDRGKVVDSMVSQTDIFPTVCSAIGVPPPDGLVGKPLQSLAGNPNQELHEEIFAEVTFHSCYQPMRSIRTSRHKLIEHFNAAQQTTCEGNCDAGPSKQVLMNQGWASQPIAPIELYDLALDPEEAKNLADDPACAPIREQLRNRLRAWMRSSNDPLLTGPVAPNPSQTK